MEVKDVSWRSLWRELTSNGWKARPPRGIEQEHRYVPPGGNARGKEGKDYFLGTTAVIQHYLDQLSGASDDGNSVAAACSAEISSPVEPQVLDVDALEDNGGEARAIEDGNVDDAVIGGAVRDRDASLDSSVDEETKTEGSDQQQLRTPRHRASRVGALPDIGIVDEDVDRDDDATDELVQSLNLMAPGDDPNSYELFDSGDELADDFDKQQEGDGVQLFVVNRSDTESDSEEDATANNAASETQFNEGFLHALGGSAALESGALNSDALREMGLTGYEPPVDVDVDQILEQPYIPARAGDDYPGLKDSYYGPSAAIKKVGEAPLSLFLFFMPLNLWRDIAVESNLYHLSTINKRADAQYAKHKRKNPSSDKTRAQFKAALQQPQPIQTVELLHVVGLLLARAIQPNKERLSHH